MEHDDIFAGLGQFPVPLRAFLDLNDPAKRHDATLSVANAATSRMTAEQLAHFRGIIADLERFPHLEDRTRSALLDLVDGAIALHEMKG